MTPYFQDEAVTLYHADCLDVLKDVGRFDVLLTDPPYGMSFVSNYRNLRHQPICGDHEYPVTVVKQWMDRVDVASYVFCRWDNLADMPKPTSVLAWVKNNWSMGDLEHEHGRQWEAICFYPSKNHSFRRRIPDVIQAARTGNNLHPTQKPESLMVAILSASSGETVVDPFAGSGTTGVAAKRLGRKCVLIEKEEKYCEIAARRLSQGALDLFGDDAA